MTSEAMLGAFARIFKRTTAAELAAAFAEHGLKQVQLNLSALGVPTIPSEESLAALDLHSIGASFTAYGAALWGISATYNTAHPDSERRSAETGRAAAFIAALRDSGAVAATLCSGSRNPTDMWGRHPDTSSDDAWRDFRESLDALIPAARTAGVLLAIEPEPANTVSDVDRAVRLLTELGAESRQVGFILDPANLITDVEPGLHRQTLQRAFDVLGPRAICVHAKDTVPWSATLAGRGVLDYELVAGLYHALPQQIPLIIQDTSERELPAVADLLRRVVFQCAPWRTP